MAEKLRTVRLVRTETDDSGTFGTVKTGTFECYSGELPVRGNAKGKSCINPMPGEEEITYYAEMVESPTRKNPDGSKQSNYRLREVRGREGILVHPGNFCGDEDKGLKADSNGCLLLGNAIGEIGGQKCLLASRDAVARFEADLERKPFLLVISWAPGVK